MNSAYASRYSLEFNPFIKNSKEIIVETDDYKELKYRLDYLLTIKGFGLVTGPPGNGKTTSLRNWAKSLNTAAYKVIYIALTSITPLDYFRQLAMGLGEIPCFRKVDNFKTIQKAIQRLNNEKKITPVFIFDEANYLPSGVLSDLKVLFNFEMDSKDKAVVILSGLPSLINTLNLSVNEPLKQRIVTSYQMEPMSKEEAKKYIDTKLKAAGCRSQIFSEAAIEELINYASGNPRTLNKIINNALLLADSYNCNMIDTDIALKAISESEI